MQVFKDVKRRIIQTAAENFGKAERVTKDQEVLRDSLDQFKTYEVELKTILDQLKSTQAATEKWTEKNLFFAQTMSKFFEKEEEGKLKVASLQLSYAALRAHEIVQRSATRVVDDRGVLVLEQLLSEKIPAIKKKIAEHNNLETDVSSYTRRAKALAEKKLATDPEVVKVREKLDRASANYEQVHKDLLEMLGSLLRDRYDIIRPVFIVTLSAQAELQKVLAEECQIAIKVLDGPDAESIRNDITSLITSGGPPPDVSKGSHMSMKGLFKGNTLNRTTTSESSSPDKVVSLSRPKSVANLNYQPPPSPRAAASTSTLAPPVPSQTSKTVGASSATLIETRTESPAGEPKSNAPEVATTTAVASTVPVAKVVEAWDLPFAPGAYCVAIHDYDGPDPGDLILKLGDRVKMEVEVSTGWWNGTREVDGTYGLFPETYVKRVE